VTGSSDNPSVIRSYLADHGFTPSPRQATWLDRTTANRTVRVVSASGEETELICLAPHGICQYKATFSPGTPDRVIIASIEAAIS
jgi:hypothetical protein